MRKSNFRDVYQTTILAATEISREPSSATDSDEAERELGAQIMGISFYGLNPATVRESGSSFSTIGRSFGGDRCK
jgi:hypothetical protein